MQVPNSNALLRNLAIIIAQHRFIFFCKQDGIDNKLQKELDQGLSKLTDIIFETVPSDFTILCIIKLLSTGRDTLWASGHEILDMTASLSLFDHYSKPSPQKLPNLPSRKPPNGRDSRTQFSDPQESTYRMAKCLWHGPSSRKFKKNLDSLAARPLDHWA
ncbi:taurine catabolism dioxygenase [Colletotrichum asianum]